MIQQEPYDDTTRVLPELRESETSYVLCSIIQTDDLLKLDHVDSHPLNNPINATRLKDNNKMMQ